MRALFGNSTLQASVEGMYKHMTSYNLFGVEGDMTLECWKVDRVLKHIKELNNKDYEKQKTRLKGLASVHDQEDEEEGGDKGLLPKAGVIVLLGLPFGQVELPLGHLQMPLLGHT